MPVFYAVRRKQGLEKIHVLSKNVLNLPEDVTLFDYVGHTVLNILSL